MKLSNELKMDALQALAGLAKSPSVTPAIILKDRGRGAGHTSAGLALAECLDSLGYTVLFVCGPGRRMPLVDYARVLYMSALAPYNGVQADVVIVDGHYELRQVAQHYAACARLVYVGLQ